MKKLSLYREKLDRLEGLKQEIEKLESSAALKSDIGFIKDIEKVLKKHRRQSSDLAVAFPEIKPTKRAPASVKASPIKGKKRSSSPTRTFKHPKSGQVIKAKRTNNKTLQTWAKELGVTPDKLEVKK
jgi:hypothetical protein